jgi:hypothetical protein
MNMWKEHTLLLPATIHGGTDIYGGVNVPLKGYVLKCVASALESDGVQFHLI